MGEKKEEMPTDLENDKKVDNILRNYTSKFEMMFSVCCKAHLLNMFNLKNNLFIMVGEDFFNPELVGRLSYQKNQYLKDKYTHYDKNRDKYLLIISLNM